MALSILDGNQSATTLSTIVSSGQHIPSHTVVSLGSQAISNITSAISGTSVCVGNLGLLQSTVGTEGITANTNFIKIGGHTGTSTTGNIAHVSAVGAIRVDGSNYTQPVSLASVPTHGVTLASTTVTISSLPAISGTVTANVFGKSGANDGTLYQIPVNESGNSDVLQRNIPIGFINSEGFSSIVKTDTPLPISGTVTVGSALPAGTNRIGVVTIGAGTVTIGAGTAQIGSVTASLQASSITGSLKSLTYQDISTVAYLNVAVGSLPALAAGTAQIGSVTASISGTVPISISSVTVGNSVTIGSLPALAAGTAQIGSVTASISGTVPISISSVTIGNSVTIGSLPAISGTVTVNPSISSSSITSGSFTSLSSATLVPANTARKMATVYNLGAGQLFVNAGASATTLGGGFMVALSSGDFYECDYTTTTLSAIFATAGTASWVSH